MLLDLRDGRLSCIGPFWILLELRIQIPIEMRRKGAVDSITCISLLRNKPTLAVQMAVGVS